MPNDIFVMDVLCVRTDMPSSANGSSSSIGASVLREKCDAARGDGPGWPARRNGAEPRGELGFELRSVTGTTSPRPALMTVRLTPVTIVGDSYNASIAELAVESIVDVVKSVRWEGA